MSFTYEEAFKESLKYFNGNELSAKIVVDKYLLRNTNDELLEKSPDDIHRRLATEFARIEQNKFKKPLSFDTIYNFFKGFKKCINQGSPTVAIGNPYQILSTSNCYVVAPPVDSYGGIFEVDQQIVNISRRRGGIGYDISTLRPKGLGVQNAARTTTGAVSFMNRFSASGREVGQGGRRGAQMISISVHHPDILDFISIKNDETSVTGANISVRLSDEFLKAVEENKDYEVRWPVDSETPKIKKTISAKLVWDSIIHNAWVRAEPGVLFWQNIISESPADCYKEFATTSVNPCQPNWAKVLTKDGIKEFKDIDIGTEIWSKEGWTKITNKFSTGIKKVYKYVTTAGIFYGTDNHWIVQDGIKTEVKNAQYIDTFTGPHENIKNHDLQTVMDGLVLGDGSIHKASGNLVHLHIGTDDQDYFTDDIKTLIGKHRPGLSETAYEISTFIKDTELPVTYERSIPNRYINADYRTKCSFLRGLYSANGSVCGNRITLKSASFKIIEDTQLILSSIGISSYWTTNKPTNVKFKNGTFLCKESYDLNITTDRDIFIQNIGFIQKYKNQKIKFVKKIKGQSTFKIISVQEISEEKVFDITVDNLSHTYWTQGCNVSNCGEITLSNFDSCRLMALNLFGYVKNPFTKESVFDYENFYKDIQLAQRLMDDLVDIELEQIDKILNKIENDPEPQEIKEAEKRLWLKIKIACFNGRRTGLGITALGDTLAALGIKYGSKNSIEETEKIYTTLKLGAYRSSVDMAKELGAFPIWEYQKEKDNPFLNRIDDGDISEDMKRYGRRNIAILTTAPTGTISCLCAIGPYFNTSSGIEPVYKTTFIRRKKINHSDTNVKVDFVDKLGDKWTEFEVYHSGLQLWKDLNPNSKIDKSPYNNSSANEIDWVNRVKLQAAAQKHIDHSISSTINLPEDVKEEEVAKIYNAAWKSGLKGVTVYRENCRSGVLIDKKTTIPQHQAPPRPKDLICHIHHCTVGGKRFFVLVGLYGDENQVYEVFAGRGSLIDEKIKNGLIRKIRTSFYKAILEDDTELSPVTLGCSEEHEMITRLLSLSLRHGCPIEYALDQLGKVDGSLNDFARAIVKVLKKYVKNGTSTGQICPECNSKLVFSEGCQKCMNCPYSKC